MKKGDVLVCVSGKDLYKISPDDLPDCHPVRDHLYEMAHYIGSPDEENPLIWVHSVGGSLPEMVIGHASDFQLLADYAQDKVS
jgi:hypothetical protein